MYRPKLGNFPKTLQLTKIYLSTQTFADNSLIGQNFAQKHIYLLNLAIVQYLAQNMIIAQNMTIAQSLSIVQNKSIAKNFAQKLNYL